MAGLEKNPSLYAHLSVARLLNKIGAITGKRTAFDEEVAGMLMSASYGKSSLRADFALGTSELASYLALLASVIGGGI